MRRVEASFKEAINMRTIFLVSMCVFCLIVTNTSVNHAFQVDEILLKGTIEAAESLVFPPNDVKVTYNVDTKEVYVKFKTPSSYKINYSDFYLRWRDNQWVVLQEFKRAEISVKKVTVETNHHDMSGHMKFIHSAEHIDKYAKKPSDEMWLRTGEIYQRSKGSEKWEKVEY